MKSARVFISHSVAEHAHAVGLKQVLEADNVETWIFEEDLPFSNQIAERIREEIAQSDHLLVILSPSACQSKWVAWELGHALQLRAQRGECYPTIIGVLCGQGDGPFIVQPLTFGGDEPAGPPYAFSHVRNHSVANAHEVAQLVHQLKPRVTFISRTDGREGELLRESFKCYEKLFPDPAERATGGDIETWIDEARLGGERYPCREVYAVLHMGELVVGMGYVTTYPARHWTFGNYFGVRRLWRSNNGSTAEWFGKQLDARLLEIDPGARALLWEVEPIDLPLLHEAASRGRIGGHPDTPRVLSNLRQVRRLNLYQQHGVRALLGADGLALPYWQPAMDDDVRPENERQLILMVRLLQETRPEDVRLGEVLDFVYDDLYGDAYGGLGVVSIPGYRDYVASVRQRVERAASGGWALGKLSFRSSIRTLLNLARQEDLARELDL